MKYFVYITINRVTGSFYIGMSNGNNHSQAGGYIGSGKVLKLAIKKYGKEAFRRFILERFETRAEAATGESRWISKAKSKWPEKRCYNLTVGGENGETPSKEAHKRIAKKLRERAKRPEVKEWFRRHGHNTLVPYLKKYGPANRVLSDKDIAYINKEYNKYEKTMNDLAEEFGVTPSAIWRVVELRKGHSGTGNGQAKLREPEVLKIRELWATGEHLQRELGAMFKVSTHTIWRIVNRKIWTHI